MGTLADFGSSYRSYAETHGFKPLDVVDTTASLRANQQTNERSLQRILDANMQVRRRDTEIRNQNLLAQNQANREFRDLNNQALADSDRARLKQLDTQAKLQAAFDDEQLQQLQQFSKTISDGVTDLVKWDTERRMQDWMNEIYTIGLSDLEMQAFDTQETQAKAAGAVAKTNAAALEVTGAPVDVIQMARNATGNKKLAYTTAIMRMAGPRYARFRESQHDSFSVKIGGKDVTLANAQNSSEYAAVERGLRDQYLSQFKGLNAGLMNKYLFPAMRTYEETAAKNFATKQRDRLQSEREHEYGAQIRGLLIGEGTAEEFQDLWNLYAGDFGGRGGSRDKGIGVIKTLLDGGGLKPEQVAHIENMMSTPVKWDDGSNKPINEKFAYQLAKSNFGESLRNAKHRPIKLKNETRKFTALDWKNNYWQTRADRKAPFTDKEELALLQQAEELGIRDLVEDTVQNDMTVEDYDIEEAQDIVKFHMANKGYVSSEEARSLPTPVVANLRSRKLIRDSEEMTPTEGMVQEASRRVNNRANMYFNVSALTENGKTRQYDNYIKRGKEVFLQYYRENLMSGAYVTDNSGTAEQKAYEAALKHLEDDMSTKQENFGTYQQDRKNPDAFKLTEDSIALFNKNKNDITTKLPNLEHTMDPLGKYFELGKGEIPLVYRILANRTEGVTAWDVAAAQYTAYGNKAPQKPDNEVMLDELAPDVKRLLTKFQTESRTLRASTQVNSKVALQETTPRQRAALRILRFAEGTDDIKEQGRSAYQTIFGYQYFDDYKRHPDRVNTSGGYSSAAAGAYQFMPATWRMAQKALGLKDFSPKNQDRAALWLMGKRNFDPNRIDSSQLLDEAGNPTQYAAQLFALLAPEWASVPNLSGASDYNQPVKQLKKLIDVYLQFEQEESERNVIYREEKNLLPGAIQQ